MSEMAQIIVAMVTVQVALAPLLTWWMGRRMDARMDALGKLLDARVESIGKLLDARIEGIDACVQEAVAAGAEEHKAWREELGKTNKRLDDLLMHLMSRGQLSRGAANARAPWRGLRRLG